MNSWVVWEELNRLLVMQSVLKFAAFEIREEITPLHGFLQVMLTEARDEAEQDVLRLLLARVEGVEWLLKACITAKTEGQVGLPQWKSGRQSARRLAEIDTALQTLLRDVQAWQREGDSERVRAMLAGLERAKQLCGKLLGLL